MSKRAPKLYTVMFSKFDGKCADCKLPFNKETKIRYWGQGNGATHLQCSLVQVLSPTLDPAIRMWIKVANR